MRYDKRVKISSAKGKNQKCLFHFRWAYVFLIYEHKAMFPLHSYIAIKETYKSHTINKSALKASHSYLYVTQTLQTRRAAKSLKNCMEKFLSLKNLHKKRLNKRPTKLCKIVHKIVCKTKKNTQL